jgi:three-Cys-motif partner protein
LVARSVVDGAPVRCVGQWAQKKIHFLTQYLGIFATGIKGGWEGHIHYVELCGGPGRCIARDTGTEMDGSALAVLGHQTFPYLETATFLDYNTTVVATLNDRIAKRGLAPKATTIEADYTDAERVASLLAARAVRGLSLVFIDPTDCSLPFATVAAIAGAIQKADLIINVATRTDVGRNLQQSILNSDSNVRAKYIKFLGNDAFFHDPEVIRMAQTGQDSRLRNAFRDAYRTALSRLDYRYFAQETVETYYDLLFASRHELGLTFWKRAQRHGFDGQRTLEL